jgi:hypothetical protein
MEELIMLEVQTRKIELEIYGKTLELQVREPTRRELVTIPLKMEKKSKKQQLEFSAQLGLEHLISVKGLGFEGKALITEPGAVGYDPNWKSILKKTSVGLKVCWAVATTLFDLGKSSAAGLEDEDKDFMEEDEPGEAQTAGS